jgi:hypothetical protein
MLHFLAFRAYINEMHGSRSKIRSKNFRQSALEGINLGVKDLIEHCINK